MFVAVFGDESIRGVRSFSSCIPRFSLGPHVNLDCSSFVTPNTMRFTIVFAILAALAVVEAVPVETNAQRMARGLPPLYPSNLKRGTPVECK